MKPSSSAISDQAAKVLPEEIYIEQNQRSDQFEEVDEPDTPLSSVDSAKRAK